MQIFVLKWWKLFVGLAVGYAIGTLVIIQRPVDYGMVLKYLTAFLSIPTAIILIFSVLIIVYKEEFRTLLTRLKGGKALGVEFALQELVIENTALVEEVVAAKTEPKQKEIQGLAEGAARDELMQELKKEADKIRAELSQRFEYQYNNIGIITGVKFSQVEELRVRIQKSMNNTLLLAGLTRSYIKTADLEDVLEQWDALRADTIKEMAKAYPMWVSLATMPVFEKAVEAAFQYYLHNRGGDYSYAMAS